MAVRGSLFVQNKIIATPYIIHLGNYISTNNVNEFRTGNIWTHAKIYRDTF